MKIRLSRSIVPNLFTVLNIFFGFLCVIHAMQGKYILAAWYIVFAAICDTLDGFLARLTRSASEFGVELDSLADVVSFGVAPSFLFYAFFLHDFGPIGTLIAANQLIFGALRLARFNVQLVGFHKEYFVGAPIPLTALTLVSAMFFFTPDTIQASPMIKHSLIGLIIGCGLLMVSTIRYPVLPRISKQAFREHPFQMSIAIVALIIIIATKGIALFPILLALLLSGIFAAIHRFIRNTATSRSAEIHEDEESGNPLTFDSHNTG